MSKPLPDLTVIIADMHELVLQLAAGSLVVKVDAHPPQQRAAGIDRLEVTLDKLQRQGARLERALGQHRKAGG